MPQSYGSSRADLSAALKTTDITDLQTVVTAGAADQNINLRIYWFFLFIHAILKW